MFGGISVGGGISTDGGDGTGSTIAGGASATGGNCGAGILISCSGICMPSEVYTSMDSVPGSTSDATSLGSSVSKSGNGGAGVIFETSGADAATISGDSGCVNNDVGGSGWAGSPDKSGGSSAPSPTFSKLSKLSSSIVKSGIVGVASSVVTALSILSVLFFVGIAAKKSGNSPSISKGTSASSFFLSNGAPLI